MEMAIRRMGMSARAHDLTLKVARTIADRDRADEYRRSTWRKQFNIVALNELTRNNRISSNDRTYWK